MKMCFTERMNEGRREKLPAAQIEIPDVEQDLEQDLEKAEETDLEPLYRVIIHDNIVT